MSEPLFRLGHSRTASRERMTFWEQVRNWFRKAPVNPHTAAIPRPPRAVLRSRTTAELTEDPTKQNRSRSSKRRAQSAPR